ncbi:transmembrane channel-like protein 3 [Agrilus planipennis]|uniref:Transmembrane channel-like protein 3 n=1 Tax=Agrilus planipennis TaxID=224129 RepID=A0A1W4W3P4_AGRPL|nr:transmembrane channel-like protein 3 [Agrilus planipennis]
MAENSRMSKLSEKEDECVFTWKVFTGWDYMIGNAETAHNRVSSIVMGFKEALLEEAEKKRDSRNWRIISSRVFVNLMVVSLLISSAWVVIKVVTRSTEPESMSTVWRRNEITVVLNLITTSFPIGFEILGIIEKYHPRKALRIQLARIMVLNLLNVYSLIFAQFVKIDGMTKRLNEIKPIFSNDTILKGHNPALYKIKSDQTECLCDGMKAVSSPTTPIVLNVTTTAIPQLYNFTTDDYSETFSQTQSSIDDNDFDTTTYESTDFQNDNISYTTEHSTTILTMNESTDTFSFNESSFNISTYNTSDNMSVSTERQNSNNSGDLDEGIGLDYYSYEDDSEDNWSDRLMKELEDINEFNITTSTFETETNTSSSYLEQNFTDFVQNNNSETYTDRSELTSVFYENETSTNADISSESENEDTSSDIPATSETTNNFSEYYKKADNNLFRSITKTWNDSTDESQQTTTEETPICETICKNLALNNKTTPNDITKLSDLEEKASELPYQNRSELRTLCWETMFGQELVKIVIMDLVMTALGILGVDFFRGLFLRVMNRCWCWDLEKKFPEYGEFKVAENILHLVNNQGMVWMGMFFSPGLVWINVIKLYILMYLRSWTVLTCNVPHSVVFRASRSNNFYFTLLLMMLFLCTLPVGYAVVWVEPSWHCGPFSNYTRIFHIFTTTIKSIVPKNLHKVLDYIASPGIIIPLLILLILIIYYLVSLTGALREANNDLKIQLRQERTEERRKMFKLVDRRRRIGSGGSGEFDNTPFARWKKLLNNLPNQKSLEEVVKEPEMDALDQEQKDGNKTKEILAKFIRKALGRASTSEEENPPLPDDATDNEQHESLPDDINTPKQDVRSPKSPRTRTNAVFQNFQNTVHLALSRKRSNSEANEDPQINLTSPSSISPKHKDTSSSSINLHEVSSSKQNGSKRHLKSNRPPKWTDNIPLITISKTESDDSLLKSSTIDIKAKTEESSQNKEEKVKSFDTDVPSGSKKVPENLKNQSKERHTKPKEKHLRKQSTVENNEDSISDNEKHKSSLSI